MNREEKIFLIECLLRDVRMNWSDDTAPRVKKVKEMCKELGGVFLKLADCCSDYLKKECGSVYEDGRFFRDEFPYGYEEMGNLYSISHNLKDKSDDFKRVVYDLITYPEYLFDDLHD